MKRFNKDIGHKKGKIAAGRFPKKASSEMLKLLVSAEANAQVKGLSAEDLVIIHVRACKATSRMHYGRFYGREMKRTNVELVVQSKIIKKEKPVEREKKVKEIIPKKEEQKVKTK